MNDILDVLKERRSIRSFKDEMPSDSDIERVVEAVLYAANGMNRQLTAFIVVKDKETRDALSRVNAEILKSKADPFYNAPVIIAVLTKKGVPTGVEDGSLVLGNMMNEAYSIGLGSCWIHRCKEAFNTEIGKEILKKFNLEDYEGVGHLALGYAKENGVASPRKENRVFYIK